MLKGAQPEDRAPCNPVGTKLGLLLRLVLALLDGGLEDVAERSTRVGRAILRNRHLLLGKLELLDRDRDAAGCLVDADNRGIDLVADVEALRPLLGTVSRQIGPLDEGRHIGADDLHLDAVVLNGDDLAGDRITLLVAADHIERVTLELLDAKRDALLGRVNVEHHGFNHVALLVLLDDLFARTVPVEVREVDHAVDTAVEADEQSKLSDVADRALDDAALRVLGKERLPGILLGLLEAEADPPLLGVDLEDLDLHLLARRDDLARVNILLGPAHLGDVDQALNARLQLHESAVVSNVGDGAFEARTDRVLGLDALPRVGLQLLHAEADALRLGVDADDLHLHRIADIDDLGGVIDTPPGHVGDVQQAIDTAQVDERAVIGDVLDHTFDDLTLLELGHDVGALLSPGLLQHRPAGDDDVAAPAIHLEDLELQRLMHQRANVADRPDIHLAARQEGDSAVEIDGEATLDLVEDDASNLLAPLELLLEARPALFAASLLAAQHRLTEGVLHTLQVDLDLVPNLEVGGLARSRKLLQRHPAFHLQADVNDGHVLLDRDDLAADDVAFVDDVLGKSFIQHGRELFAGRRQLIRDLRCAHQVSFRSVGRPPPTGF